MQKRKKLSSKFGYKYIVRIFANNIWKKIKITQQNKNG